MTRTLLALTLLLALVFTAGTRAQSAPAEGPGKAPTWEEEVAAWKQNRFERLQQPDGWLTLVGLGWLKEGTNSIGSDPQSAIVLPAGKAPARLGTLRLSSNGKEAKVTFRSETGVAVTHQGAPVATLELVADADGEPTVLEHGSLSFYAIRRGDRLGMRVKDSEAATLKAFHGLDYYPLDRKWKIAGRFEAATEPREIAIPNALGFDEPILSPGYVVFTFDGQEHRLLALDDTGDGRLFLVFGDKTNGKETYGGGRFLYTDAPQAGQVELDFNRSYNPPCVFTPYATCPLPPRENRLPFRIEAGEKSFAGHDAKP
ncbi:MAG: DUF1684 domain-containing protein [Thermoanaerobaculia bacterium]